MARPWLGGTKRPTATSATRNAQASSTSCVASAETADHYGFTKRCCTVARNAAKRFCGSKSGLGRSLHLSCQLSQRITPLHWNCWQVWKKRVSSYFFHILSTKLYAEYVCICDKRSCFHSYTTPLSQVTQGDPPVAGDAAGNSPERWLEGWTASHHRQWRPGPGDCSESPQKCHLARESSLLDKLCAKV